MQACLTFCWCVHSNPAKSLLAKKYQLIFTYSIIHLCSCIYYGFVFSLSQGEVLFLSLLHLTESCIVICSFSLVCRDHCFCGNVNAAGDFSYRKDHTTERPDPSKQNVKVNKISISFAYGLR